MRRLTQLAEVSANLDLEARIRDGAQNMLKMLDARGDENEALRSQIQRELSVAEAQLQALQARKDELQQRATKSMWKS